MIWKMEKAKAHTAANKMQVSVQLQVRTTTARLHNLEQLAANVRAMRKAFSRMMTARWSSMVASVNYDICTYANLWMCKKKDLKRSHERTRDKEGASFLTVRMTVKSNSDEQPCQDACQIRKSARRLGNEHGSTATFVLHLMHLMVNATKTCGRSDHAQ